LLVSCDIRTCVMRSPESDIRALVLKSRCVWGYPEGKVVCASAACVVRIAITSAHSAVRVCIVDRGIDKGSV
jgi:hypothetical protein